MARETPRYSRRPPEHPPGVLLWRLRSNPLRRRTDLVQAWIALGLILAVTAAVPAAMFLVGDAAYRHHRQTARDEAAVRHHTPAVLLHDAPRHPEPGSPEAKSTRYPVTVRFTDPHGRTRTARADVEPALRAGSEVRVWVGEEGRITGPPLTAEQVRNRTMGAALVAALTVPAVGAAAYGWAARRLERRNLARWDIAWARTAPRWTTST
ncbi:Rv1733c family protein [Streptomyces sp. NPDC001443]